MVLQAGDGQGALFLWTLVQSISTEYKREARNAQPQEHRSRLPYRRQVGLHVCNPEMEPISYASKRRAPFGRCDSGLRKRIRASAPVPEPSRAVGWWESSAGSKLGSQVPRRGEDTGAEEQQCYYCRSGTAETMCERCERSLCDLCTRACDECAVTSCAFCMVVDYQRRVERCVCFGCWDGGEGVAAQGKTEGEGQGRVGGGEGVVMGDGMVGDGGKEVEEGLAEDEEMISLE